MMLQKQTDANWAVLLCRSQLVIISRICISNPIPSCGRQKDNNMQMSSSEWKKEGKKTWWGADSRNFLFGAGSFGRVYLAAADGGEGRVTIPIHSANTKKVNRSISVQFLQQIKTTFANTRLLSEIRSRSELGFDQIFVENPWKKTCQHC